MQIFPVDFLQKKLLGLNIEDVNFEEDGGYSSNLLISLGLILFVVLAGILVGLFTLLINLILGRNARVMKIIRMI